LPSKSIGFELDDDRGIETCDERFVQRASYPGERRARSRRVQRRFLLTNARPSLFEFDLCLLALGSAIRIVFWNCADATLRVLEFGDCVSVGYFRFVHRCRSFLS